MCFANLRKHVREAGAVFQVKEDKKKWGKEWRRKRAEQMGARCDGSYLTFKDTKSKQMNWIRLWTNGSTHTSSWNKQSERARIQMRVKWQNSAGGVAGGRGEARTECILSRFRERREQHGVGCTGPRGGRRREDGSNEKKQTLCSFICQLSNRD